MKFTLTVQTDSLDELQSILSEINGSSTTLSIAPETPNSDFPDVPQVTGTGKPKRATKAKEKFVDPGDRVPAASATPATAANADPFATPATPAPASASTSTGAQLDDFGDPIAPAAAPAAPAAPALTMEFLRSETRNKSMIDDSKKAKAQALVKSYGITTLADLPADKWSDYHAKLTAL